MNPNISLNHVRRKAVVCDVAIEHRPRRDVGQAVFERQRNRNSRAAIRVVRCIEQVDLLLRIVDLDNAAFEQRATQNAVEWPARLQRLTSGPLPEILGYDAELWLDGGHNPAAGEALADTLAGFEDKAPKPVFLVVGMMGQKDALGFLAPFRGLVRVLYTVPIPGAHEAPHSQENLAEIARSAGLNAIERAGVVQALETIAAIHDGPKRVLICGSLYLAGHVLALQQSVSVAKF